MFVFKRDGHKEPVRFDKITARIQRLCYGLDTEHVDAVAVTQRVISGVYQGVNTIELDNLAAETAAYMTTIHPDYAILAARIAVLNLHKQTTKQFSQVLRILYEYINPKTDVHSPMISKETTLFVRMQTSSTPRLFTTAILTTTTSASRLWKGRICLR